jgi:hypothetical protein
VALLPLSADAVAALAAGDLGPAEEVSGMRLPACFAGPDWVSVCRLSLHRAGRNPPAPGVRSAEAGDMTIPATTRPALSYDALPAALSTGATRTWTDQHGGAQLRCCLRHSRPGERIALVAVTPEGPQGAYRETGPVFLHADDCPGRTGTGYPDDFRDGPKVFRVYDAAGAIGGGELVPAGTGQEEAAGRLLSRPGAAFLQVRNVVYGCYVLSVRRR